MPGDTYCALPHASISMDGAGRLRICCNNRGHYLNTEGPFIGDITDPVQAMNTDLHREVRTAMSRGERHWTCSKCWDMEDSGSKSFRQIWNDILGVGDDANLAADGTLPEDAAIRYVDITFGNKCNLVCRMCNWSNSHLWYHDNLRLGRTDGLDPRLSHQFWFEDESIIDLLLSRPEHMTHFNFLGGEPLIVPQHMDLLSKCVDLGIAGGVHLSYNTNLTRIPSGLLDLWGRFKHVNVNVSLEGVGVVNDYIRQNSDWQVILDNIRAVHDRVEMGAPIDMSVHSTMGVLNALTLWELVAFSRTSPFFKGRLPFVNVVYYPNYQDPRILPTEAKMLAAERLMSAVLGAEDDFYHSICVGAVNHMMSNAPATVSVPQGWPEDLWSQFWHDADEIDALKNRRMADYLPELEALRPR